MPKKATATDAQLIMQLYDLRREPEMRKARHWWVAEFWPQSVDDVLESCLGHGHAGKQLAAPGRRILEHGGGLRASRGAE